MTIENKRKEVTALIDKIKEHSDRLSDFQNLPLLELEVITSKISKLQEKALILKYLLELEQSKRSELSAVASNENVIAQEKKVEEVLEHEVEVKVVEPEINEPEELNLNEPEEPETIINDTNSEVENLEDDNVEEEDNLEEVKPEEVHVKEEVTRPIEELFDTSFLKKEETVEKVEENKPDFFDEVLEKEEEPISLDDIASNEEMDMTPDINERFSETVDSSVSNQLQQQPIKDLLAAIGLNERYLYANDLFDGDMEDFKRSVQLLNDFETVEEAEHFFNEELRKNYAWEEDNKLVDALYQLVKRRFNK